MQSSNTAALAIDADVAGFRVNPLDFPDLDNIVVSPCGTRIESFDYNGSHFVIDWDELCPPGAEDEDEEGMSHEDFMAEMRQYCEEVERRHEAAR
jgi:hypothetical protein